MQPSEMVMKTTFLLNLAVDCKSSEINFSKVPMLNKHPYSKKVLMHTLSDNVSKNSHLTRIYATVRKNDYIC